MALVEHCFAVLGAVTWVLAAAWWAREMIADEASGPVSHLRPPLRQLAAVSIALGWPLWLWFVAVGVGWEWARARIAR